MPGITCKCGNIIKYGEIPNPNEWLFISDIQFDNFVEKIDVETLYKNMKSMLICHQCGRLWFFWGGFNNPPTLYEKE